MFSEETNGLIQAALDARESIGSARSTWREKQAARQAAADEEKSAVEALNSASTDLTRATEAAMAAIRQEFTAPDGEGAPAQARPAQKRLDPRTMGTPSR